MNTIYSAGTFIIGVSFIALLFLILLTLVIVSNDAKDN